MFVRMRYHKNLTLSSKELLKEITNRILNFQLKDKLNDNADLLNEDKVILTLCAFVDLIFIPERDKNTVHG